MKAPRRIAFDADLLEQRVMRNNRR